MINVSLCMPNPLLLERGGDYLGAAAPQRADGINLHAGSELCEESPFVSAAPVGFCD